MVKVLKMPRDVLIAQPLTRWTCLILKSCGKLSTKKICSGIRKRFPVADEFPKGLAERTVLDYLNTMQREGILNKEVREKNVAFWELRERPGTDIWGSFAGIDMMRISRAEFGDVWNYIEGGITVYEFPRCYMDGDKKLMGEFKSILQDLKKIRIQFYYLTRKVLERWKRKIIHKIIKNIIENNASDILDKQLGMICCFFLYHDRPHLKKWFGDACPCCGGRKFEPDIELADLLKKIFYPSKTTGELLMMIKDREIDTHTLLKAVFEFNNLGSIPSTIVIRIPEPRFDKWVYNTITKAYRKEENIGIPCSKEMELFEEIMKEHRGDFYERTTEDDKSIGKEIGVSKIKAFVKNYAPDILSKSET